jgi:hypothetical protein
MYVKRVLGSERCYLMSDGSKIPFEEKDKIFGSRGKILQPETKIVKPTESAVNLFGLILVMTLSMLLYMMQMEIRLPSPEGM